MNNQDKGAAMLPVAGLAVAAGGALFGALLAKRHRQGKDDAPAHTERADDGPHTLVGRTVTVGKPRAELYAFWRDPANLAKFMENVERVEPRDDAIAWTIKAPAGHTVELLTQVEEAVENERIAWRSLEESQIHACGEVTFTDAPGERGTRVSFIMRYNAPAGAVGRVIGKVFLREPEVQARHDLKRFKMLMETGEIATSARRRENTRAAQQMENA